MKGYWINSELRTITEVEWKDFRDLQRFVGGSLCTACRWPKGSVLYVDDDGLRKPQSSFFRVEGYAQPLAGNGILTGPDTYSPTGDDLGSDDPEMSISDLMLQVQFMSRLQFDSWLKANASEPSLTIVTAEGSRVLRRYGSIRVPRKE